MKNSEKELKEQNVVNVNVSAPSKDGGERGPGVNKYLAPVKDFFGFVVDAKAKSIIKFWLVILAFFILFLTFKFAYNAINNEQFMSALAQKMESSKMADEENKLAIRAEKVTPQIQHRLKILCYTLNADRAFLFELHNGKKNASGLPFRYADMSYEVVNDEKNISRVAMQFQNIPLTLYAYPHYLAEHRYLYGDLSEIAEVDMGFAKHIEKAGGKYLGMVYLTSRGLPLGFICVSFHEEPKSSPEMIKSKLEEYALIITPLLDLDSSINI